MGCSERGRTAVAIRPSAASTQKAIWFRFLAGLSIVTATLMGELLVATIIVLMLSEGQALEEFATQRILSFESQRSPSRPRWDSALRAARLV
jgi:hypothetical protein